MTINSREKKRKYAASPKGRAQRKAHYESKKDYYVGLERARQYRVMYGISVDDYDRMFLEQRGRCRICGSDKPGKHKRHFSVDHDHANGRVRGLLCVRCNVGLGWMERFFNIAVEYADLIE